MDTLLTYSMKGTMLDIQTPKVVTIPATELNLRAGNVLRRVAVDREHIIIERSGYPLAVMIPMHDYQQFMEHEKRNMLDNKQS